MKFYITKQAKNGTNVFLANKFLSEGKTFTNDISKSWFFFNKEDAVKKCDRDDKWCVVDEKSANKLLTDNIVTAVNYRSTRA